MAHEALALVTVDESTQKFVVNEEGLAYLRSLGSSPLAVVACAGTYRTGKSYLLNALSGNSGILQGASAVVSPSQGGDGGVGGSFPVGSTVKACTKGIWLCGGKRLEGSEEDIRVVFLDTEGLASTSRSESFDVRLFSLALLLSSVFLYNSVGTIDGQAISRLGLVAQLTRHIHTRTLPLGRSEDSGTDFSTFFPAFVWVVRDMTVKLEREGKRITSREYLEDSLKPEGGLSEESEGKNAIRAMLRSFFPERDCVTLVRPCNDEAALKNLATAPTEALRPEFRAGMEAFSKKVNALCAHRKKSLYGNTLNGAMLAHLVSAYADALNSGAAPTISSAWERVVEAQCGEAVGSGFEVYKGVVGKAVGGAGAGAGVGAAPLPLSMEDLLAAHGQGQREGFRAFAGVAIVDPVRTPVFEGKLRDRMDGELTRVMKANDAASQKACEALLESLGGGVKAAIAAFLTPGEAASAAAGGGGTGGGASEQVEGGAVGAAALKASASAKGVLSVPGLIKCYRGACETLAQEYSARAPGPAAGRVLGEWAVSVLPGLLAEGGGKVEDSRVAHATALGVWAGELAAALGVAKSGEASARATLEGVRREGEAALLALTRSGAEALERVTVQLAGKEREAERAGARLERLEASQEASRARGEEAAARVAGELSEARKRVEELIVARSESQVALATSAGRVAEVEAQRGALERTLSDTQRALAEETRVGAQLGEKFKAAAEERDLLRESLRLAKELAGEEKASRVATEDTFVSLKAHVAQCEVEKGDLESERNQLQTLAMTLKEALEKTGNTKKITALFASNKMLVRLWETL